MTILNGILYRVTKDPLTKRKRFQFLVPESLKGDVWCDMERDALNHVKCHRCVLSKTPEPFARAPLESIKTSALLELMCIDFWSAQDSDNKSVDVCKMFVSSFYSLNSDNVLTYPCVAM